MNGFTENQRRAIESRGDVLVIAGAGTGKTRTLVHRCVEWLMQKPSDHSLDQLLMVTFTDAAAAEMRQRIRQELKAHLEADPGNSRLAEELALLDTAFISTLHSFCFRLVRQHFYELDLDPQLTVLAEEEAFLLAEDTLTHLLKRQYEAVNPEAEAVRRLIQIQAGGWEVPVRRLVRRLYQYAQTLPNATGWFDEQIRMFESPSPTPWREWFKAGVVEWRDGWLPILKERHHGAPNLLSCLAALKSLPNSPGSREIRQMLLAILEADQENWPAKQKTKLRQPIEDLFEEAAFLVSLTGQAALPGREDLRSLGLDLEDETGQASDDPLTQDWNWTRPLMVALLQLTRRFGQEFGEAKRQLGVVDFNDLEQLSLRLLWDRATSQPTELAREWKSKLKLVFVDEYQDINAAQDAILRALSGEGAAANRFLVGDPKQSIYRFRLADPRIFQRYTEEWSRASGAGRVVPLTENFRSRESILRVINSLFSAVMRKEIGGLTYDETAQLRFGDPTHRKEFAAGKWEDPASSSQPGLTTEIGAVVPETELHIRLTGSDNAGLNEEENGQDVVVDLTNAEREARLVGQRLVALKQQKRLVWDADTQQYRPVEWRDMVILLRSPQFKAEGYAKEFCRLGIPLNASRTGFFESPEIMDLLALLQLLDNPLQDVPLLTVLRSPIAMLTLDELALIRLSGKGRFWIALQRFHRLLKGGYGRVPSSPTAHFPTPPDEVPNKFASAVSEPALRATVESAWQKADSFLQRFTEWRKFLRESSLSQGLDRILGESQYTSFCLIPGRSQQQKGNICKLLGWAKRFDQFQRQGLYRFLKFIQAQQEAQIDHEPAPIATSEAVRLMSIHQSKGLEFPIVVLADLGKTFNLSELRGDVLLDEVYGICPLIKPHFTEQRFPSLPYWLARRRQRQERLGEEMRLLYVGMTRACQSLILVGTVRRTAPERWAERAGLGNRDLLSATNYLDWIGPWMSKATGHADWAAIPQGRCELLHWSVCSVEDLNSAEAPAPAEDKCWQEPAQPAIDPKQCKELLAKLSWTYPFGLLTEQPAKLSVSTLRAGLLAEIEDEAEQPRRVHRKSGDLSAPALSAAAIGTAHHTFLEHVALDRLPEVASLQAEAERLEQQRILTSSERNVLDLESIAAFWRSEVGHSILSKRSHVHRELPFTARLALGELKAFEADEKAAVLETIGAGPVTRSNVAARETMRLVPGVTSRSAANGGSDLNEEFVIVTGVVDLVVLQPNEIWFLDFKTDAADAREWKLKAAQYEPQMKLYALALSRIYSRPVTRRWLHSLTLRRTLEGSG